MSSLRAQIVRRLDLPADVTDHELLVHLDRHYLAWLIERDIRDQQTSEAREFAAWLEVIEALRDAGRVGAA